MVKETTNIFEAVRSLESWIDKNGWAGWDPYDIREKISRLRRRNKPQGHITKVVQKIFFDTSELFPLAARKLCKVEPKVNAKAMGLFLAGYANLYRTTLQKKYLMKALECADWLIQNRHTVYSGYCWGYPFNWQSIRHIPKDTPSSVVTATGGDGFFLLYKVTNDKKLLEICEQICVFFLENLRVTYRGGDAICYSYTPIDNYQVHNANLFVGEFLVRIGKEIKNPSFISRGISCGKFALKEQQAEGFLPYWGLSQTDSHSQGKLRTDHYHSGFEIRMLYKIWKKTGIEEFKRAYLKYFRWYLNNMFVSGYIPKMTCRAVYPVNIHSCAEALLCQSTLLPDHPERIHDIFRSAHWILKKMEYASGRYAYLVKKYPVLGELSINFTMIRWGQAWMLRAYSELLKAIMNHPE